jgi:hypothetical protein
LFKIEFTKDAFIQLSYILFLIILLFNEVSGSCNKTGNPLRTISKNSIPSEEASRVISFYHLWGLITKKKLLPSWVFDSISGERVVQLYRILSKIIDVERKENPRYAEYFEWLKNKIISKGYVQ